MEWMILPFRRYAEFSGRSRRLEYWMYTLFQAIVFCVLLFLIILTSGDFGGAGNPFARSGGISAAIALMIAWWLGSLIPGLAVTVRRFHDQGQSGWFVLFMLIPWIGGLIIFVFMLIPGTVGDNAYGPDPKGQDVLPGGSGYTPVAPAAGLAQPAQRLNISGFGPSGHVIRMVLDPASTALRDRGLKIGRSPTSDMPIDEETISREHAEFILLNDSLQVRDLGSTNGTRVNGRKLAPFETCRLWPGDSLAFGKQEFLVSVA